MVVHPRRGVICLVLLLCSFIFARPVAAQTGLVAAFGFNEGAGATAADASGNGNTGTVTGATWSTQGKFGGALSFNGTTSWVTIPDSALLDLSSAMTIEAWVNASTLGSWRTVVLKESANGLCYSLYASDGSSGPSGWMTTAGGDQDVTAPSAIALNTWVHLAVTYNGATLAIYVNGAQVASKPVSGAILTSSQPLRIGGNAIWNEFFSGRIDEVRIYNRALTATQIQSDMATPVGSAASPDFTIAATPAARTVAAGSTTSYTVDVAAVNGFTGTVALGVTGLPSGATGTFSPATIAGSGTATLTVSTATGTPPATSPLTVTGTSGSRSHSAAVSLTVSSAPDFTLSASPPSAATAPGGSATYTVSVAALNGFSGAVALAVSGLPSGATGAFAPTSINPGGTSTLTVSTSSTTPAGTSTLVVTGTSGTRSHSATVQLTVNPPAAALTIGIDFVGTGTAMAATENAGIVPIRNWNSATGASRTSPLALVDQNNAATGATVVWSANGTWRTPIADVAGNARMMRGYLNTTATSVTTVSVAGLPSATYDVYVYADGDNGGDARTASYAISGPGITATSIGLTDPSNVNFSSAFTQASGTNGNYVRFTFRGTAFTLSATPGAAGSGTRRAPVNAIEIVSAAPAPDFTLSASPASATAVSPGSASYTVTAAALNGFTGTVSLAVSGLPTNTSAAFTPAAIGAAGAATLVVTTTASTPSGTFPLTVTGTSGTLAHAVAVSLTVTARTFSISGTISPAALGASTTVNVGGAATASATANALGAFTVSGLANGVYQVTPGKNGVVFTPPNRTVTIANANATGVNFAAASSNISVSVSSPANGSSVPSAFSMTATASAGVAGVQFRVDGANVGAEDTAAPFTTSVTARGGSHTLTAVARDASGNTVTSAPVTVTVGSSAGTALSINGLSTFQAGDGFGVNINSLSWKNGELRPALDLLIDDLGVQTWRVVFDMEDWEDTNDNADPNTPNWTFYNALYSNAKFQNLWGTLQYLNSRGVTSGIMVSFMGQVPPWMGGPTISATMEDEWVEMVATLLFYARNTANVQFDMVDPLNEPDWDGFEGPQVDQFQYVRLMEKLSVKLDAMGLSTMRFVGPNTASVGTGVDFYLPEMVQNSVVMSKLDHFGFHSYAEFTAGADAQIKALVPTKNFWMTELSIPEHIFTMIGEGAASAMVWDAFDSVYNHAILAGAFYNDGRGSTPPNDAGNGPALLSYDSATGTYATREPYRQMQAFKYVARGSVRIAANESNANLTVFAYRHPTTGRVTIVGRNIGASSITLSGSMSNVGTVGSLQFYQTNVSDSFDSFNRGADAVVTNGSFVVTVPANSFFTLTSGQ